MPLGPQGGIIPFPLVSIAGANTTLIYSGPCHLDFLSGFNVNTAARYVKIFDAGISSLTSGFIGTPATAMFGLPGNTAGAGSNLHLSPSLPSSGGLQLFAGLGIMLSSNMNLSGSDVSGVGAGDVLLTLGYRT